MYGQCTLCSRPAYDDDDVDEGSRATVLHGWVGMVRGMLGGG